MPGSVPGSISKLDWPSPQPQPSRSLILVGYGRDFTFNATSFLLFCVVPLRDEPTGMFPPGGQESSLLGQLCPPASSTGLEARQMLANKCGRKGGMFLSLFSGNH